MDSFVSLGRGLTSSSLTSIGLTGVVVKSFVGELVSTDADLDGSELWASSISAFEVLLEDFGTSDEGAVGIGGELIDGLLGSLSNLASWDVMLGQGVWDVGGLDLEELTALLSIWWCGIDVDLLVVDDPLATLESGPLSVLVLVDVSFMMPVSLIPGPLVLETFLGWTPVVVSVTRPFIPDTLSWVPLPLLSRWLRVLVAPVANVGVVSVLVDEVQASLLGLQDVLVLSINRSFGLSEMSLGSLLDVVVELLSSQVIVGQLKKGAVI